MANPTWIFRAVPADGGRTGGDPAAMNFRRNLHSFAREVLQNSLDARPPDSGEPVLVRFRLRELGGVEKRRFLEAADFERLAPHLQAAGRTSALLREGLERSRSSSQPLRTLEVADFHTFGLTGPEKGEGRYASLVRHKLVSEKGDPSAGGSFGLGKSVLWMFSGWGTIFVRSLPSDPDALTPSDRFVGVAQLPYHEVSSGPEKGCWDGPGWFGEVTEDESGRYARSFAIEPERARALGLARDPSAGPGTSILVVDFLGDEEHETFDPDRCARAFEEAALHYFWPALCSDPPRLEVEVVTETRTRRIDPWASRDVRVFAHLAGLREDARLAGATREDYEPLRIPATKPLSEVERAQLGAVASGLEHAKRTVSHAIRVRVLDRGDASGSSSAESATAEPPRARLALLRGSGMVVRYEEFPAPRPALAVALAGRARGDSLDDRRIERFLRTAEPPRHDDWTADAPHLPERYRMGYKGELRGLKKRLQECVLRLLREDEADRVREEVPEALQRALRFRAPKTAARPKSRTLHFGVEGAECDLAADEPLWRIVGWLEAMGKGPLALRVDASIAGDGGDVPLEVERFDVEGAAVTPGLERRVFVIDRHGRFDFRAAVRLPLGALGGEDTDRRTAGLAAVSLRLRRIRLHEAAGEGGR